MDWNLIGLWCGGVMTGAGFGWFAGWIAGRISLRRELFPAALL